MSVLKQVFLELLEKYTGDQRLANQLWTEIETCYSGKERHYHTLSHLDHLLAQLTEVKAEIKEWDTILFTLYYHDIIYDAQKPDNEEKSAELAERRMKQLSVSDEIFELSKRQIAATKTHQASADSDTNYFTDADLSILGQPWEVYSVYGKNVRREYAIYPDSLYNPGRKNVLNHFLSMPRIFKTSWFYNMYETQARENLEKEAGLIV